MKEQPAKRSVDGAASRVLHIVEASFAGVGRHVFDLANEQARRGADVHVIFSPLRESTSFASERLASVDVTFHSVPMTRSAGFLDAAAIRTVTKLVRNLHPEVIHGHSTKGGLMARLVPRRGAAVLYTPNAVYSMNPTLGRSGRTIVETLERLLSHRTDVIVAVSPEERDHLRNIGVPDDKCVVIPNGVHPFEQADPALVRAELGLPADVLVFGFVGRLDDQKAPGNLLAAFSAVADRLEDAHLAIIGDGPLAAELHSQAERADHSNRIHLLGEQPGRWAMSGFDVFVLPSRYEGFPYVLIEASSAGLPLITTDGACASQLVKPEIDSWIVPAGNVAALGTAMLDAAAAPSTKSADAAVERRSVARAFSVHNMVDGVEEVIRRSLAAAASQ